MFVKKNIYINFTINDANNNLSQFHFSAALPSNIQNLTISEPHVIVTKICPSCYYCPFDTTTEIPCPAGTYFSVTNANNFGQCQASPTGTIALWLLSILSSALPGPTVGPLMRSRRRIVQLVLRVIIAPSGPRIQ